ncbi:unnamed protein product [Rotaria sordida]|uniref:Uncharacterized protein n=1 Tax=Rotaria sordida TaxID=392033 RepID=A0A813WWW2_9BILA|nr:unnamed protein product [Rotaria sordida]CAF0863269.1 unnamed protein product [Rotaria sordida]CAF1006929.1 unnamed protein product [Rotaria sordida]CAF3566737.1 unnamed protein product [Rotaria sordida]CAF3897343.1 unnamed protein product [Rotaria sordida]
MSYINQRKHRSHFHKVKRLNNINRHDEKMMITNLPFNIIGKTSKYTKFFDYPLSELFVDHSTDPLENTTRQYIHTSSNISNEGRFKNHEMIIRRNGETTILRPKQDLVLVNGFTPVIRPSTILPSYQSMMSHTQVASSLSIMNKMSIKKPEQTSIIKSKRKNRRRRKRLHEKFVEQNNIQNYNFSNEFDQNNSQESTFINLVQQALHEIIDDKSLPPQPVPLMSILPKFHDPYPNYNNQSSYSNQEQFIPPLSLVPTNSYSESSYNFPQEQNHSSYFAFSQHEHVCLRSSMSHHKSSTHMTDYFF